MKGFLQRVDKAAGSFYRWIEGPNRSVGGVKFTLRIDDKIYVFQPDFAFKLDIRFLMTAMLWLTFLALSLVFTSSLFSTIIWSGFVGQTLCALGASWRADPWNVKKKIMKKLNIELGYTADLAVGATLFAAGWLVFAWTWHRIHQIHSLHWSPIGGIATAIAIAIFTTIFTVLQTKKPREEDPAEGEPKKEKPSWAKAAMLAAYIVPLLVNALCIGSLSFALPGIISLGTSDSVIFGKEIGGKKNDALNFLKQITYWAALVLFQIAIIYFAVYFRP